jgi:radical SAM protein with 4Fe4S-binding SPASM domain
MTKEEFFEKNKTVCIYPWVGMYVDPAGDVYPCCVGNTDGSFGNVKNNSLIEIWNSTKYKDARKTMIEGKFPKSCGECERLEKYGRSVRNHANNHLGHNFPIIESTELDGYLEKFELKYLDIRFSNICNFKCRYCGELLSSAWGQENRKVIPENRPTVLHASDGNRKLLDQVIEHLDHVEMIYFAGGEPLVNPEHYEILEFLVDNNLTHVKLWYNSNCSKLTHKVYNVIDMWKKFDFVYLQASLDSFGVRAEYMRHGTDWDVILKNLKEIRNNTTNVEIGINCVVSSLNILTLTDFLENLIQNEILPKPENYNIEKPVYINFYPLTNPIYFKIDALPLHILDQAVKKIDCFIEKYKQEKWPAGWSWENMSVLERLENLKNTFIKEHTTENTELARHFKKEVSFRDSIRQENFTEVFPELKEWYDKI